MIVGLLTIYQKILLIKIKSKLIKLNQRIQINLNNQNNKFHRLDNDFDFFILILNYDNSYKS